MRPRLSVRPRLAALAVLAALALTLQIRFDVDIFNDLRGRYPRAPFTLEAPWPTLAELQVEAARACRDLPSVGMIASSRARTASPPARRSTTT
jgi:hypothetical protein